MKKYLFALLISFQVIIAHAQQPESNKTREIVFLDVNVIPMLTDKVVEHQTVVVKDGRITQSGSMKKIKYEKEALVIDGKGKYLMPGLAEMHAHVPPVDDLQPMKDVLLLFAANGVTTIRGMLGHPKHLELRAKINSGEIMGPHFYTTGPSFNGISVTSASAGSEMVKKQKQAGYDYLKLHPGLSREKFDAIVKTAKEEKIPFVGHVSFGVGIWHAIESGYSSIDHMDGFVEGLVPGIDTLVEQQAGLFGMFVGYRADTTRIPKLVTALKQNHIWVVPTQSLAERWFNPDFEPESFRNDPDAVYMTAEVVNQWIASHNKLINTPPYDAERTREFIDLRRKLIYQCHKNGVGLLLGSDAPQVYNVPGFSVHDELEYLVAAGLSPYEALKTGTVNVAAYLKKENSGIVAKGAPSDLILLNGNPLQDIAQTKNISGVMLGNKWLSREYLETELKLLRKQ
jgi:imidazolonepropionase-like amidohydrolase